MNYSKPACHYSDLTRLLMNSGMNGDPRKIEAYLRRIRYYRLSGYWLPFRRIDPDAIDGKRGDEFVDGTHFRDVIGRYGDDHWYMPIWNVVQTP